MPDSWDDQLHSDTDVGEESSSPRRSPGLRLAAALMLLATGVAAYVVFGGRWTPPPAAPVTAPAPGEATEEPVPALGGAPEPVVIPPLADSDEFVRELVRKLSAHPRVAAWLATDGLVRNFTVVVSNVAEGKTPARHLALLRLSSPFRVVERGADVYLDPQSYERYTALADAAASIDPAGAARLYSTLKPRIEEAHRELGSPDRPFDRTLEEAIVLLLETPVVDDPVRVEPRGIGYGFADPQLEALTDAEKQLLRAGSRNVRVFQGVLRQVALALGIPARRMPTPR